MGRHRSTVAQPRLTRSSLPNISEVGAIRPDDFVGMLSMCFMLDIVSDPSVGFEGSVSKSKVPFKHFDELASTLANTMKSWLSDLLRRRELRVPMPLVLYQLFQPLLHPVLDHSRVVKITVESEEVHLSDETQQLALSIFDIDGYLTLKYGWTLINGIGYLTSSGEYLPVKYGGFSGYDNDDQIGSEARPDIFFQADPRHHVLSTYRGDVRRGAVYHDGKVDFNSSQGLATVVHASILPRILIAKSLPLTRSHIPSCDPGNTSVCARIAYIMVTRGSSDSLAAVCSFATHLSNGLMADAALANIFGSLMQPGASGETSEPPSLRALRFLQIAEAAIVEPTSLLYGPLTPSSYGIVVMSLAKSGMSETLVPAIFAESLCVSRTVLSPFSFSTSESQGGVHVSLRVQPVDEHSDVADLIADLFGKDKTVNDLELKLKDFFKIANVLNTFATSTNHTLMSKPLVKAGKVGGIYLTNTSNVPEYIVPKLAEFDAVVALSYDRYILLTKAYQDPDPTDPTKSHLQLASTGKPLRPEDFENSPKTFVNDKGAPVRLRYTYDPGDGKISSIVSRIPLNSTQLKSMTSLCLPPIIVPSSGPFDSRAVIDEELIDLINAVGFLTVSDFSMGAPETFYSSLGNPNGEDRAPGSKLAAAI